MKKSSKRKLAKFLHYAGAILMLLGFIYILGVAGESDFESEIHQILHPSSWYLVHGLIGLLIMSIGLFIDEHKRECFWFIVNLDRIIRNRVHNSKKEDAIHG